MSGTTMSSKIILALVVLAAASSTHVPGTSDPTDSQAGDPTGAVRSMKPADGEKPNRTETDVPKLGPTNGDARIEAGPLGAPASTSTGPLPR